MTIGQNPLRRILARFQALSADDRRRLIEAEAAAALLFAFTAVGRDAPRSPAMAFLLAFGLLFLAIGGGIALKLLKPGAGR